MTADRFENTNLVDPARSMCLCDVGLPGYVAALAVGPDGLEHLALGCRDRFGDPTAGYDHLCADVAHEQEGELPSLWRARVWLAPLRCGATTRTGRRCRQIVSRPGRRCGHHRKLRERTA
jgi:hypothetical protein